MSERAPRAPRALLVEDEPDHGLLLRILLERDGIEVTEAPDIDAACRMANRERPDVVVFDLPSGRAGGVARCQELRAFPGFEDVPLVALSSSHDRNSRDALLAAGVDGLLGKPVVPWLLEWQVRAALRRPQRADPGASANLLAENRLWMSYLVHDLNNPLTVIGGNLALMALDPLSPRQRQALEQARGANLRLCRLVRSLLDVERIDAGGHLHLEAEPVSIAAILDDVAFVVRGLALPWDVSVEVEHAGEVLWALDRELVERALINLGENAVRHAPRGSRLRFAAREEGDCLLLSVADQGPGVPADDRVRIFERDVQIGDRRSRGTAGLGLAFCKLVAEGHGGRTWVEADSQGGAVFVLSLPWPG